jgi:glycosyltransferase involved in cell wall biosynthesis
VRVAIFTDNDFNKVNGVTTALSAVLDYAPSDVRPRIYTAGILASDQPDYLALRSLPLPIPFYRGMHVYVPKLRQYLRRVRADGVDVLHLTTPGPLGLTALWIARETGLPLVGSFHTDLAAYTSILSGSARLGRWMHRYLRWPYRRCRIVLVPSAATRAALAPEVLPPEQLIIWPRGVDAVLFEPARRSSALRASWRCDHDHPALLYAGRLSREKGIDLLPGIVHRLRALGIVCRVIVAGHGPDRRRLADACPEAIFTGMLGRQAIAHVFASADLLVFPSRTDTAGNVVLEAQASGLPVVVGDAGGPRENMIPGITGLVCDGEDPQRWGNAIATLLRNTEQRRAMGVAARQYALGRHWDRALEPLFETYRHVHANRATPAPVGHAA